MQFIDLAAQYQHLKAKIDARIQAVLDHGQYIMGPEVGELEQQLADYVGVKHVIIWANGTAAWTVAIEPVRGASLPRRFFTALKRGLGR